MLRCLFLHPNIFCRIGICYHSHYSGVIICAVRHVIIICESEFENDNSLASNVLYNIIRNDFRFVKRTSKFFRLLKKKHIPYIYPFSSPILQI